MNDKANQIHSRYQERGPELILKIGDSTNLADIEEEVKKIYEWESEYFNNAEYRKQLPESTKQSIEQEFENAANLFDQIINLRSLDIAQFANKRFSFVQNVNNYYKSLYDTFTRDYRGWKLDYYQSDKVKELDAIFRDVKKRQKSIEDKEEEVQKTADATNMLATEIGLSELAQYFYQLYSGDNEWMKSKRRIMRWILYPIFRFFSGYSGGARTWLLLTLLSFCAALIFASTQLLPYINVLTELHSNNAQNFNSSVIYAVLVAKSLILIVPIYAIRFCLKNYGSNKHLATDALHKAKSLQTLPTYLRIAPDDNAKSEIASSVAKLVFSSTASGFITQKGDFDGSDITINTPQIKTP